MFHWRKISLIFSIVFIFSYCRILFKTTHVRVHTCVYTHTLILTRMYANKFVWNLLIIQMLDKIHK